MLLYCLCHCLWPHCPAVYKFIQASYIPKYQSLGHQSRVLSDSEIHGHQDKTKKLSWCSLTLTPTHTWSVFSPSAIMRSEDQGYSHPSWWDHIPFTRKLAARTISLFILYHSDATGFQVPFGECARNLAVPSVGYVRTRSSECKGNKRTRQD